MTIAVRFQESGQNIPVSFRESSQQTSVDFGSVQRLTAIADYPEEGNIGDILMKTSMDANGVSWITPASNAEEDNTRPITAAAVYTEIGNINALLATI